MDKLTCLPQNVLIIEYIHNVLTQLTDIVHYVGCIARPVSSARHAVDAIEALPPNLIIMDISIPDIDGLLFCTMLKKNSAIREIPVIFVSTNNSLEYKIKCYQVGAIDFIPIPFEAEEVAFRLKSILTLIKEKHELEENYIRLYSVINDQIKKVYEAHKHVVYTLVKLVVNMNPDKANYYECVAKNSRILAISLQLTSNYKDKITTGFIDAIELAAPLFDIGSMCRGDIRRKNDSDIRNHPLSGAAFLEEVFSLNSENEILRLAIDIVRYHHENWNGSGYPEGVDGVKIPLGARIVSVITAFNLLISSADYGKSCSYEDTMEFINDKSGVYYDPDIVYVLNKIKNQLKY